MLTLRHLHSLLEVRVQHLAAILDSHREHIATQVLAGEHASHTEDAGPCTVPSAPYIMEDVEVFKADAMTYAERTDSQGKQGCNTDLRSYDIRTPHKDTHFVPPGSMDVLFNIINGIATDVEHHMLSLRLDIHARLPQALAVQDSDVQL